MKPHKWAKEIKAWADGAEIEQRYTGSATTTYRNYTDWHPTTDINWDMPSWEYRIKPQQEEPYWLCCGSLDPHHHKRSCSEAKAGYPERCRFGTASEHFKPQPKEPQYLYIYERDGVVYVNIDAKGLGIDYIGKIKLEQDE